MAFNSPFTTRKPRRLATLRGEIQTLTRASQMMDGDTGIDLMLDNKQREYRHIEASIAEAKAREAAIPIERRRAMIVYQSVYAAPGSSCHTPYEPASLKELMASRDNFDIEVRLPEQFSGRTPVPHSLLTSLFSPTRRARAASDAKLNLGTALVDGVECNVRYEGPRLTTGHADVFFGCLSCISEGAFDVEMDIGLRGFLKRIGRNETSGTNHSLLVEELKDLTKATFFLEYKSLGAKRIASSNWKLLSFDVEKPEGSCSVIKRESVLRFQIPSETAALFGLKAWSSLDLDLRAGLSSPLAKWLYGYVSTKYGQGHDKVADLHALSGSLSTRRQFRAALFRAVAELRSKKVLSASSAIGRPSDELYWSKARGPRAKVQG